MDEVRKIADELLREGYLLSLCTVDESGPWVCDLVYVSDDEMNLYWKSQERSRHSTAILNNPRAAASISVSNKPGEANAGLQIAGEVEKVEAVSRLVEERHNMKKRSAVPEQDKEVLITGEAWYRLKPTKIEVIYEPRWGYLKQTLRL
jgi:uncharacterized protein YhbP (UPF0306 family)